jgi:hypothetical protein
MEVVNSTAVQVSYHRRASLNEGAVATRLLGWRRKVGAIGFSRYCREVFRRQPNSVLHWLVSTRYQTADQFNFADGLATDAQADEVS